MKRFPHRTFFGFILAIALLAAPWHTSAGPTTAATTAPVSPETIASLRTSALGDDYDSSMAALRQLAAAAGSGRAAGPSANQTLLDVATQLLARDSATIETESVAAVALLPRLRATEAEIESLRAPALQAIDNLTQDPEALKAARRNYARLSNTAAKLTPVYSRQFHVVQALARRAECLAITARAPGGDADRLARVAEQALAMPPDAARKFLTGPLDPPADPIQRRLWFYIACRRIDAWNRLQDPEMNSAEIAHARRVNFYRELLGLLPYEVDARLVQSARRHSKEMMDLWYFSHYSPTESERSPFTRMVRAGYAAGSNENITMGSWTGDDAFWQFFNSPEHHRAWMERATAIGIGKWENAWTQDIGAGRRLMLATPAERAKAMVSGPELKPQVKEQTRQHPRDLATIKFYDESGQEMKALPGLERKISTKESP